MVFAQAPTEVTFRPVGNLNANELSASEYAAAPKECILDFHYSAPQARIVMESLDGSNTFFDRVFPLNVQVFPDSTYVYGKPGAWTVGLGVFEGIDEFRVRVVNANAQGPNPPTVAEAVYP